MATYGRDHVGIVMEYASQGDLRKYIQKRYTPDFAPFTYPCLIRRGAHQRMVTRSSTPNVGSWQTKRMHPVSVAHMRTCTTAVKARHLGLGSELDFQTNLHSHVLGITHHYPLECSFHINMLFWSSDTEMSFCRGHLSETEAKYFYVQLLTTLDYCHKLHIYHRDVKPENLLLTSQGENLCLKLCDFTFAFKEESCPPTSPCGTPQTMGMIMALVHP